MRLLVLATFLSACGIKGAPMPPLTKPLGAAPQSSPVAAEKTDAQRKQP
ncbi:MAG: lipoprotein [Myxococcota bacterium]|jgi:hypothetical protein|nr:lipoprotein [Myxococcota bacterium]